MGALHSAASDRERSAARYHRRQLVLGALGLVVGALYLAILAASGAGRPLAGAARGIVDAWWFEVAFVGAALGLGHGVLTFPLAWMRGWLLPRRFGLLHQPVGAWLADRAKGALVGSVLALVVVEALYGLLRASAVWWLLAAGFVTLLSLLATTVFPVWIVPLFYRMTPLADDGLRQRLLTLAARAGIAAVGVFVVDQSRKSRTANAALAGFGRTRRIILFDTLVTRFPPDEIEAILAHELGHHVHRDMWRSLALQAALAVVTFGLADAVLRATAAITGLQHLDDPAGLPWLALVLGAVGFGVTPLGNLVSRRLEYEADAFVLRVTGAAEALVAALDRLADLNLAERNPLRLEEALLHSHPSIERRIARVTMAAGRPAPERRPSRTTG